MSQLKLLGQKEVLGSGIQTRKMQYILWEAQDTKYLLYKGVEKGKIIKNHKKIYNTTLAFTQPTHIIVLSGGGGAGVVEVLLVVLVGWMDADSEAQPW